MAADDTITLPITIPLSLPRTAFVLTPAPPELLSQNNIAEVCGISPKQYVAMLRTAAVPVTRVGRLRLVERAAFLSWVRATAEAPSAAAALRRTARSEPERPPAQRPEPQPAPARSTREFFDPVEVLARKLGGEVSAELAEAAAREVRELREGFAKMMDENRLVPAGLPPPPRLDEVAGQARTWVKWAAHGIGDQKAFDRFAAELGEARCPSCCEWCLNPPCVDCRRAARGAARVPCSTCAKPIDPCREGLCSRCRKAGKPAFPTAGSPTPLRRRR
ncbi:MAG: hypothetical protein HY908_31130 [Myxococcales bacterium]|nr:hypothetical protein [Myxococcales bacterium]